MLCRTWYKVNFVRAFCMLTCYKLIGNGGAVRNAFDVSIDFAFYKKYVLT